jgi:hypothetical protein
MDTEGANYYSGTRTGPGSYNSCRICLNSKTNKAEHFECGRIRLSTSMKYNMLKGYDISIKSFLGEALSFDEKEQLHTNMLMGIQNIDNPLFEHIAYLNGSVQLGELFPFDMLHTNQKGIVQNCIAWTVVIVACVGSFLDSRTFGGNLGILDERIRTFSTHGSMFPFGCYKFSGISDWCDTSKLSKEVQKGVCSSMGLPAYQLPALLWQVRYLNLI